MIILIAVALIPLAVGALIAKHHVGKHGVMVTAGRVMLGRHPSGYRHTNRSFWRASDGTVKGSPHYSVRGHHHRAEVHNLLRSGGTVLGLAVVCYGLAVSTEITAIMLLVAIAGLAAYLAWRAVSKARTAYSNRTVVRPLAHALAVIPGTSAEETERAIKLKPGYLTIKSGEIGRVEFPDTWHGAEAERETVEQLLSRRLPMSCSYRWHAPKDGKLQYVVISAVPPMTSLVPFASVLTAMADMPRDEILIGKTSGGEYKTWNCASEEPELFVSAPTRRGKTTIAMLIMAQILNQGGTITAIDPKAVGLDTFCAGHPNATVYADNTDIESMWRGITAFRKELNARIEAFKADRTLTFTRHTLILDEVSVFNMMSQARWDEVKPPKSRAIPPVWADIQAILFTGAQFSMNMCIFGQRVDFRTLGGLIDGFGTRLLAGYNKQTYMRLIGELPIPKSHKVRGRFLYFTNGDSFPQWIQVPYGTVEEMRDYAMEPIVAARNVVVTDQVIQGTVEKVSI